MSNPRQGSNYLRSTYNTRYKGASIHDEIPSSVDPEEAFIIRHNAAIMDKQSHSSNIHALTTIHVQTLGLHPHQQTRNRFMFAIPVNPVEAYLRGELPIEIRKYLYEEFLNRAAVVIGVDVGPGSQSRLSEIMPFRNVLFVPFWRADGHHYDEVVVALRHENEDKEYSLIKQIQKSLTKRPDYTESRLATHEAVARKWAGPYVDPCFRAKKVYPETDSEMAEDVPQQDEDSGNSQNDTLNGQFRDAQVWSAAELKSQKAQYLNALNQRRAAAQSANQAPEYAMKQVQWTRSQQYSGVLPSVPDLLQSPPPQMQLGLPAATENLYARAYAGVAADALQCGGHPKALSGTIALYDRLVPTFREQAGFTADTARTQGGAVMAVTPDTITAPLSEVAFPSSSLRKEVPPPKLVPPKAVAEVCRAGLDRLSTQVAPLSPVVETEVRCIPFELLFSASEHRLRPQDCYVWPLQNLRYNCEKAQESNAVSNNNTSSEQHNRIGTIALTWLAHHGELYRRKLENEPLPMVSSPYEYIKRAILPLAAASAEAPLALDSVGEQAQQQQPPVGVFSRYAALHPPILNTETFCYKAEPAPVPLPPLPLHRHGDGTGWVYGRLFPEVAVSLRRWLMEIQAPIKVTEDTALWLLQQTFNLYRMQYACDNTAALEVLGLVLTHEATLQLLILYCHYMAQTQFPKQFMKASANNKTVPYHSVTTDDIYMQALLVAQRVRAATHGQPGRTVVILPLLADTLCSAVLSALLAFYSQATQQFPVYVNHIVQLLIDDTLSKAIDAGKEQLLLLDSEFQVVASTRPRDAGLIRGAILSAKDQRVLLETVCVGIERLSMFLYAFHKDSEHWSKKNQLQTGTLLSYSNTVHSTLLPAAFQLYHELLVLFSPLFATQVGEEGMFSAGLPQNMLNLSLQRPTGHNELYSHLSSLAVALLTVCDVQLSMMPVYARSPTYAAFSGALFDIALAIVAVQALAVTARKECQKKFQHDQELQWKYASEVVCAFMSVFAEWKEYQVETTNIISPVKQTVDNDEERTGICIPMLQTRELKDCVAVYGEPDVLSARQTLRTVEDQLPIVQSPLKPAMSPAAAISHPVLRRETGKLKKQTEKLDMMRIELANLSIPPKYLSTEEHEYVATVRPESNQQNRRMNKRVDRKLQAILDKHSGLMTKPVPKRPAIISPIPNVVVMANSTITNSHNTPTKDYATTRSEYYKLMQRHSQDTQPKSRSLNTKTSVLLDHVQK